MQKTKNILAIGALSALFLGAPAYASFSTGDISLSGTVGGLAVSGTANFSFNSSTDLLTIMLTNTSTVTATGQLLSDVGWNFVGGTGTNGTPTITSGTNGYTCTGNGIATSCVPNASVAVTQWHANVGTLDGTTNNISALVGNVKGTMIVNSTITSVGKDGLHVDSPYLQGPVTFTTTVTPTSGTITGISDVFLSFGTAGGGVATPEPGFYGVLALGISGLWFVRRPRKKTS